ncbi:DUF4097 family beta strand repeat protein [Candidatus Bipolaricaulota bacterium]|nr:DUF4097 family beta strand repeat protein [Candidatus Bipolaricaulota bacterium]
MKRLSFFFVLLACIGAIGSSLVVAEPVARGFGFGGAMAMAFFPDMTGINTFMSENGLPSMGDFLIGSGGGGRGGVIGGPSFGGVGWGMFAMSENEEIYAEFVSAGGGFDIGAAIGGNERSVLTIGTVLGGGANVLSISSYLVGPIEPEGLIPEPTYREIGLAMGFVQPYVSMSAQLLPWMGFEFRIGYIFPVFGIEFGDLLGIPAPSLKMSGPTVSFGLAFGGIGSGKDHDAEAGSNEQVTIVSDGSFAMTSGTELVIENALGDIVISSYAVDTTDTEADLVVEWQAARTAKEKQIDELHVVIDGSDLSATLQTVGTGRVNYVLQIPTGIDLRVKNGLGNITLANHEAQTIIIENGVGDVNLQSVNATVLIVAGGIGEIDLPDVDAQQLIVNLGIGEIDLTLPVSTSARVIAKAGVGDVTIDRFPGMTGGVHGFFGKSGNVTLGHGERMIELNVGLGEIVIEMQIP